MLDTNAYIAFKQGNADVLAILQHADEIGLSAIVLGELVAGFAAGTKTNQNLQELNVFIENPRVVVYEINHDTAAYYAKIYAGLRKKGKPIPTNDLWIAASVLQRGCKLCSFDSHFSLIDNLMIANSLTEFLI
jgi:predicted nucleic acid-binding protein